VNALFRLWDKLTRSKKYRHAFVASQLKRGIPTQIRILRKQRGWTQAELAESSGLTQGALSRAEDPDYGNLTFNNVLKIAEGFDVAFVGKFVPFSELAKWYDNLSEETLQVLSFDEDSLEEEEEDIAATIEQATPVAASKITFSSDPREDEIPRGRCDMERGKYT
jgi:transcriptional regulator with XRE-family HTH domain